MTRLAPLAFIVALLPTAALACSCPAPEELSDKELRSMMRDLSLIAHGQVVAVNYPIGCRVAPLRLGYALASALLPVTYSLRIRQTLWGRPVAMTKVVQHQAADWDECRPLGSAACQPRMPVGDALWVLSRLPNGEQRNTGRCGLQLAPHFLRLSK